jgi:hypothetical protein
MKAIKAAAVQAAPVYLNLDASIAKAARVRCARGRYSGTSTSSTAGLRARVSILIIGLASISAAISASAGKVAAFPILSVIP